MEEKGSCKVSVIIPYVDEKIYIDDCLDSLEDQTCRDFEAVVVCDHSGREALERLKGNKVSYPLTILEIGSSRTGVAAARNDGLRQSRGEYILFLDCDDYLEKTALAELLQCAAGDAALIRCGVRETWYGRAVYYDNGEELDARNNESASVQREDREWSVLGWMIRRDYLAELGCTFDESYRYYTDLPFVAELLAGQGKSVAMEKILYLKRRRNDPVQLPSLSQIPDETGRIREMLQAYRRMKELLRDEEEKQLDYGFICYFARHIAPWFVTAEGTEAEEVYGEFSVCCRLLSKETVERASSHNRKLIRYASRHGAAQIAGRLRRAKMWRTLGRVIRSRAAAKKYLYRKVFSHMKLREDTIVFESFLGRSYSDSPRALFEYLSRHYPGRYKHIWILNEKRKLPFPAKCIPRYSFRYFYYVARAKYFIFNNRQSRDFVKRDGMVFLETWHGTPLKKLALDLGEVMASAPLTKRDVYRHACEWDYLIVPNQFSADIFRRCFLYQGVLLKTGYPRNDMLYLEESGRRKKVDAVRQELGIPEDRKVILYAPTWRDDEYYAPAKHSFCLQMDLKKMRDGLGSEYVLLLRTHYYVAEKLDLSEYSGFLYDVSGYPDIAELYLISDLLITDYSSVFFDYANLRRPMLFFTYDLEKYRDILRGFYMDMEEELPGPMLFTTEEIIASVENLDQIQAEYEEKYNIFYKKYCGWEDGRASQRVVDAVFGREQESAE